jgi:exodeoxyribonuclease III
MSIGTGQLALVPAASPSEYQPAPATLRVMTWNVQHASTARSLRQAAWIAAQPADVIVLTEVAATSGGHTLEQALRECGFTVCRPSRPAGYGTLIASRIGRQETCPEIQAGYLPHRCATIRLHLGDGPAVGVVGLYVPSRGSRDRRNVDKRAFQNAISALLPSLAGTLAGDGPILIAGDLNVVEPGHQPHLPVFGAWEYDFYQAFGNAGYGDAFRHLHPEAAGHSWYGRRSGLGYRIDHIFCAPVQAVTDCAYLHHPRQAGLSDHSPMTATIALPTGRDAARLTSAG